MGVPTIIGRAKPFPLPGVWNQMSYRTTPPYPYPLAPDMGAGAIIELAQSASKEKTHTHRKSLAALASRTGAHARCAHMC